jgi:hypothetical protein
LRPCRGQAGPVRAAFSDLHGIRPQGPGRRQSAEAAP